MRIPVPFRFSLQYRVALAWLLLGWFVSMLLGGILYTLTINMERQLIEETLSIELEDFITRYQKDPTAQPPSSNHIQGYVITPENQESYPSELQNLPNGLSSIQLGDTGFFAEARQNAGEQFIVLFTETQIKKRERQYLFFLAIGVMFITLISSFLGLWLAKRVISPVTGLAEQVSTMDVTDDTIRLADTLPNDELGELAEAIDGYRHRLSGFIEREQAFTSDASHELRTPLAVIEGAAEVLLEDPSLSEVHQKKIKRIARSAHQINRLTNALLSLAREETDREASLRCPLDHVLKQVVEDNRYLLDHKPVTVTLDAQSQEEIPVDAVLLYIVLANVIRNAFSYTNRGSIDIASVGKQIVVRDTGAGLSETQIKKIFQRYYRGDQSQAGHGIGLSLVQRICDRYGWTMDVSSRQNEGTKVELHLNSAPN